MTQQKSVKYMINNVTLYGYIPLNMGASLKLSISVHFPRRLPMVAHFSPLSPTTTTSTTADASIPALNIKADIRTALISLLESDDEHMAGIISAISVVIVEKLAENSVFA